MYLRISASTAASQFLRASSGVTPCPVTTPPELTVAIEVLPANQVPPEVASLKVIVEPAHTVEGPEMEDPPVTVTVLYA